MVFTYQWPAPHGDFVRLPGGPRSPFPSIGPPSIRAGVTPARDPLRDTAFTT